MSTSSAAAPITTTVSSHPPSTCSARSTQGPDPLSANAFGPPKRRPAPAASSTPATRTSVSG